MTQAPTSQISTRSGRNNQVSPRETLSNHVRRNGSPQAWPPQTPPKSRAHKQNHPGPRTRHEMAPWSKLQNQQSGAYTRHPERTRRVEATEHGP
ncbi:hypothetical protein Taro_007314 [Colocasia esculenta]|uniref:Uncharacterized protein n=1 Tax=Colocasia esculenta TaxID=4460 RepID=A0A843TTR4_COLES|nr:hypothetical protein [Colocasia esculenta]